MGRTRAAQAKAEWCCRHRKRGCARRVPGGQEKLAEAPAAAAGQEKFAEAPAAAPPPDAGRRAAGPPEAARSVAGVRKGTKGVSAKGVTANFMDRGQIWGH